MEEYSVSDGYIERKAGGGFEGNVCIEGVNLSPIVATYFQHNGENYLWLKRKPLLEYDLKTQSYKQRNRRPSWECYLKKQIDGIDLILILLIICRKNNVQN